ncbi:hypothetical protein HK100_000215 [Physocladia obscura]|uniref:ABC transporter domain-containing protein n=1 Tax=Physocladia obscura TaxID=109957 RepID=A0AAD5XFR8_9FUNG|nr:hypothetical protein HK100_000215 [Physocladia obscura]
MQRFQSLAHQTQFVFSIDPMARLATTPKAFLNQWHVRQAGTALIIKLHLHGSYCLSGQTAPIKCSFMSICNASAKFQQHYGLIVILLIIDICLAVIFIILRLRDSRSASLAPPPPSSVKQQLNANTPSPAVTDGSASADSDSRNFTSDDKFLHIDASIKALTAGFNKGLDGRDDLHMNYEFDSLSLRLPDGKNILQGVSGAIKAGRMTAIMGPSGAGKTTFMSVLMGKVARTSGTLKINNAVTEMNKYRKIIGYVPQDDVMIEELTVRENIRYSARARLPNTWTNKEVDDHVDAILNALNLSHVAHKRIGNTLIRGISGGQRKRVNIGIELAAAPLSVFLDEPTSGLDSTSALDSVRILRSISRLGLTIVAVIHQPRAEIFESFDDVLMIAPGGRTAYFGPVPEAKPYYQALGFHFEPVSNDADTLMDILSGRGQAAANKTLISVDRIVDSWKSLQNSASNSQQDQQQQNQSDKYSLASMEQIAKLRGASFIRQLGIAHNRYILQQYRLVGAFILEVFVGLLAGGIMGIASGGNTFSGHYIYPYTSLSAAPTYWFNALYGMLIGIAIALAAAPSGVKVFGEEKAVYIREFEAGHDMTAYFVGKNISILYRITLSAGHFAGFYYFLSTPPIDVGLQFLLILLNFFGMYGMAQIVSMMVRRENAPLLAVTIGLIWQVLCGFGPSLADATSDGYVFVMDIGVNRWMAEAQYALWAEPYGATVNLEYVSESYGYQFGKTTRNALVMVAVSIGYRIVSFGLFLVVLNWSRFSYLWITLKANFLFRSEKSGKV